MSPVTSFRDFPVTSFMDIPRDVIPGHAVHDPAAVPQNDLRSSRLRCSYVSPDTCRCSDHIESRLLWRCQYGGSTSSCSNHITAEVGCNWMSEAIPCPMTFWPTDLLVICKRVLSYHTGSRFKLDAQGHPETYDLLISWPISHLRAVPTVSLATRVSTQTSDGRCCPSCVKLLGAGHRGRYVNNPDTYTAVVSSVPHVAGPHSWTTSSVHRRLPKYNAIRLQSLPERASTDDNVEEIVWAEQKIALHTILTEKYQALYKSTSTMQIKVCWEVIKFWSITMMHRSVGLMDY